MPFRKNDRVEFDNKGETIYGIVDKGGATPNVVADGRKRLYKVPEARLRHSNKPIPPEDRVALGLDGNDWKAGDRVMFEHRGDVIHGTVTKAGPRLTVIQDGGVNQWKVPASGMKPSDAEVKTDEPHEMDRYGLSNYRQSVRMSRETVAFNATVTLDGRPIAEARNDGGGGSNVYYPTRGANRSVIDAFEKAAAEWLADMGMPEKSIFEAADWWLDWKATKAPYNVTAREEVQQSVDLFLDSDADEFTEPSI